MTQSTATAAERHFVIRRTFNAPVSKVYQLWTEPALVARWWGIKDCSIPHCVLDVRVGGAWRIDMLTRSGRLYRNHGLYLAVEPEQRIEYTDLPDTELAEWAGTPPGPGQHAVTFEPDDDVTHVSFMATFANPADRQRLVGLGMRRGWLQTFDRLALVIDAAS